MADSSRFNPWAELRSRPHIVFIRQAIPGRIRGFYARRGDRAAIFVDVDLDQVERNAVLAHELVHDERGLLIDRIGMPPGWRAVVAREEAMVDREVARRLVPPAELLEFVERRVALEGCVDLDDIAEEFEVPRWVAAQAVATARRS